ncbi:MAG: glycosyltransferase family 4 protein [Lachnospiraceae bacterium]|nr:glycosyltransferase family 4 protein [Lachnospiraceae bacterium]
MKLLFVHNTLPEFRVAFFESISKRVDVRFIITHPDLARSVYGDDGTEHNELDICFVYGKLPQRLKKIKKEIELSKGTHLILPPADSPVEIAEGLFTLWVAKRNGLKLYTWTEKWEAPRNEQPMVKRLKNNIHRMVYHYYTKSCDKCIVFGTKAKEYLQQIGVEEKRIVVSYMSSLPAANASKGINVRRQHCIESNKKIVFCLARMIPRKGIDVLIHAVAQLRKKHNDFVLLLGGDGPLKKELQSIVKDNDLDNVVFAGHIPPELRREYYRQSDLFVLPSKYYKGMIDGWGLPINESLYYGTPVVATTCEGAAYDLIDGDNGAMVEQNNVKALALSIEEFLYHKNRAEVETAIEKTVKRYNIESMASEFLSAFPAA